MRILLLTLPLLALAGISVAAGTTVLSVDDGNFLYDSNGDCVGDTDGGQTSVALHHWHYSLPFAGVAEEVQGGFGCKGAPRTWSILVPEGQTAQIDGRFRYGWDRHVFPGGGNDIHLLVLDAAGAPAYSTLLTQGTLPSFGTPLQPVTLPTAILERSFATTLGPGEYTITEDVTSGAHTAYATRLTVTIG